MKILALNTSPNGPRSSTLKLVNAVLEGAKTAGAEVEVVDLCKLRIDFCIGCRACFRTGECFLKDDYDALLRKMLAADGMVWASPNYSYGVKAQMKALIDRMADVIHCQSFDGKYACAVATGGRDHRVIIDYLRTVLLDFGACVTGGVGAVVTQGPHALEVAQREAFALGRSLAMDISSRRIYPDQRVLIDENRHAFQEKIRQAGPAWKHEVDYWEARGWS